MGSHYIELPFNEWQMTDLASWSFIGLYSQEHSMNFMQANELSGLLNKISIRISNFLRLHIWIYFQFTF